MQSSIDLRTVLQNSFGFPNFRPGQQEALEYVLAGRDTLVVMPTGHGKSLIYQLAALQLPGTTIVVSPLISLMKDQVDSLERRNIPAAYINSTLNSSQQRQYLNAIAAGGYKIVFVAPERLRSRPFLNVMARLSVSLLVVDEAHCLSQWGHDFRPDYLRIAAARRRFNAPVTLALTATATRRVQDDIVRLLELKGMQQIITGFNRPNLALEVFYTPNLSDKLKLLTEFLKSAEGAGIIYAGTRRDTEEVASFIDETLKIPVRYYHAGLEAEMRGGIQEAFISGDLPLIVATNAFGMGIDRPDVRFVLHYSIPGSLEAYYQEAGRAGRDGLPARAGLFYSPRDSALHEYFIENDSPNADELRSIHQALGAFSIVSSQNEPQTSVFRLDDLTGRTGLPEIKTRVALEQLEAAGALMRLPDEAGGLISIQPRMLSENALQKIAAQVEARRKHKRATLAKMVQYAETNDCRRNLILKHFGDTGSTDAPICCDNCLSRVERDEVETRPAETQSERAALIVLETISKVNLGKQKIAKLLRGSRARDISRYTRHPSYGKFAALQMGEIETLIDQLLQAGYLKSIGSRLPTLALTSKGQNALKARAAIQVNLRHVTQSASRRKKAELEAGGTLALTCQLLESGLTPSQIAAERGLAESTIYTHLARLIIAGKANVDAVVPPNQLQLIRDAIRAVGSAEYLFPIKEHLPDSIGYGPIRCVVEAWRIENGITNQNAEQHLLIPRVNGPADPIATFLSSPHPRPLKGPWLAGWALDFHSRFEGHDQVRGVIGDLVYRYKYVGQRHLAAELACFWTELLSAHPEIPKPQAIIPIPPSTQREFDPVTQLARALAGQLNIPVLMGALVKTRQTRPQKELKSLSAKRANVAGAFALKASVAGKHLLLVDDLYDSGATLSEATRILSRNRPASIVVLTLTKTIHSDQ